MVKGVRQHWVPLFCLPLTLSLGLAFAVSSAVPAQGRQLPPKLAVLLWPPGHGHVVPEYSGPGCLLDLKVSDRGVIRAV